MTAAAQPDPLENLLKDGLVLVESGSFTRDNGSQVTLDSFRIGKYPVTQALWQQVMGNNPSYFKGSNRPVEKVSWFDACVFCNALSEKKHLQPCYFEDKHYHKIYGKTGSGYSLPNAGEVYFNQYAGGFRLPTEAEWEFAARGGSQSQGFGYAGAEKLEEVGWFGGNSHDETKPVGLKLPNELGLYDMSGNVWEWCWDWYDGYPAVNSKNPVGADKGTYRVLRGGSYFYNAENCRTAYRIYDRPEDRINFSGFRLACSVPAG